MWKNEVAEILAYMYLSLLFTSMHSMIPSTSATKDFRFNFAL